MQIAILVKLPKASVVGVSGRDLGNGRQLPSEHFNRICKALNRPELQQRRINGNMRSADPKILFNGRKEIR